MQATLKISRILKAEKITHFIKADICDADAINQVFEENEIDRVVHFAAESHVDRSIKNPDVFVKTNVLGTLVMLNAAKAAWELHDGSFKTDKEVFYMSLRMRCMVPWKRKMSIFMKRLRMIPIVHILQAKLPLICW